MKRAWRAPGGVADVIILAAGASTRMGHPKALTPIGGDPALARMVRACEEAGLPPPIVVLGGHHDEVRAALPILEGRVRWARNPRPEAGRTGSLQVGLSGTGAQEILVWPVDHPLVAPATLRALVEAQGHWVVPTFEGRGGHPLRLRGMAVSAVESAPAHVPLRDLPPMVGLHVTRLPVEDPGVLANLDTPEDLARLG